MDIKSKLAFAERAIASIGTHDDEDSVVLLAALDRVTQMVEQQAEAVRAKQAARASDVTTS